jgi:hypothetical protein
MKNSKILLFCVVTIIITVSMSVLWIVERETDAPFPRPVRSVDTTGPEPPPELTPASVEVASKMVMHKQIADAPGWTVSYGQEFWHRPANASSVTPGQTASQPEPGNLNLGNVIERVSHAIQYDELLGLPKIRALQYSAVFDEEGFTVSPHRFVGERELDQGPDPSPAKGSKSERRKMPIYEEDPSVRAKFRTLSVEAGGEPLYTSGNVPASFLGNTGQRLLNQRAGLIEHFETGSEGVEVSWVFQNRFSTPQPVVIRAELTGLDYAGADDDGHVFADLHGSPQLRVDNATLVDARGGMFKLPIAFEDGQLVVQVEPSLLAKLEFPIAIDPLIGPAAGGGLPMAADSQDFPSVAWNASASRYLVVWNDYRSGSNWDIYGTRVHASGRIVDVNGILIFSNTASWVFDPVDVASNGSDWLVVWTAFGVVPGNPNIGNIYGARVSGSTPGATFVVCNSPTSQTTPKVASLGTEYFVVWFDERIEGGRKEPYGVRISSTAISPPNGDVICTDGWRTETAQYTNVVDRQNLRIGGNGSEYLVTWDGVKLDTFFSGIYGGRISLVGSTNWTVACTDLLSSEDVNASQPAVAGQNDSWFVPWTESGGIFGASVDASGNPDPNKIAITGTAAGAPGFPAIAGNGSGYLVAWLAGGNVRGARIDATGVLDQNGLDICVTVSNQINVAVASKGDDYLVVWASGPTAAAPAGFDFNIYGARVASATGKVLDRIPISTVGNPLQQRIALPSDSPLSRDVILAVWEDGRNSPGTDIYGARILSDTEIMDVNGLAIATGAGGQLSPAVSANNGSQQGWFVVWRDDSTTPKIYGRHVPSSTGDSLSSSIIPISTGPSNQISPKIAGLNGAHFVVWMDDRNTGSTGWDVYGALVTYSGGTWQAGSSQSIVIAAGDQSPSVGRTGDSAGKYLVAWHQVVSGNNTDIYGALFNADGSASGSAMVICNDTFAQSFPSVAGDPNGVGFGVVWADTRSGNGDVYGTHVSAAGVVGGPANGLQISSGSEDEHWCVLSYSPTSANQGYLVAWHRMTPPINWDISGARIVVESNNVTLDPAGVIAIANGADPEDGPTVGTVYSTEGTYHYRNVVAYRTVVGLSGNNKLRANLVNFNSP